MHLQSRNGRPLTRYFPELAFPDTRVVLDGEIVIHGPDGRQLFNALGQRIHPAASRIQMLVGADAGAVHRVRPARARRRRAPRAALRRAARRAGGVRGRARRPDVRAHARRARPGRRRGLAARRRGRHRQGARRALQARRAHGHGEDQAGPDDRRGRPRLAARQGRADGRLAHPRPVRRGRQDPRRRPHERVPGEGEARARRPARAVRDRRARLGGPVPVGERPRARVDRAAPRARRRGLLRPRERRAHPARDEGAALARGPRSASPACSPSSMGSVPRP